MTITVFICFLITVCSIFFQVHNFLKPRRSINIYIQLSGHGTTSIFLLNVKGVHIPCISVALPTKGKFIFDLDYKNNML